MRSRDAVRRIVILICACLLSLTVLPDCPPQEVPETAGPQPEATIAVPAGDTAALVTAIDTANENLDPSNILQLGGGVYTLTAINGVAWGPTGLPAIAKNLTIEGNGSTITRDGAAPKLRIFTISPGVTLTLRNLTVSNGLAQGGAGGSGFLSAGGGGAGLGGAVFNDGGTLVAETCTFTGNSAVGGAGGSCFDSATSGMGGGGGVGGSGGNGAGHSGGGGGGWMGNGGTSNDDHNTSGGGGGGGTSGSSNGNGGNGSYCQPGAGGLANGGDGGIHNGSNGQRGGGGGGGGSCENPPGGNGGAGGDGGGGGGAGQSDGGAFGGGAGGFGGGGGGPEPYGNAGWGGFGGGGASWGGGSAFGGGGCGGTVDASGGGAGLGGAIFNDAGAVSLTGCTLSANTATGGAAGNGRYGSAAPGSGLGGGLFNVNGSTTLTNCTLTSNTAAQGGSALYNLTFGGGSPTATLTLTSTVATGNVVNNGPGASLVLTMDPPPDGPDPTNVVDTITDINGATHSGTAGPCLPHSYLDAAGICGGHLPCYTTFSRCKELACAGGTLTVSAGAYREALTVDEDLIVDLGGDAHFAGPVTQTAGVINAPPGTWTVLGDFLLNGGTFHANGGTLCFGGSGGQTAGGSGTISLDDVTVGPGCLGYWKLDEGSGGTAADSSGHGQAGTIHGSPAWLTVGLPLTPFSDPSALLLNGSSDFVQGSAASLPAGHDPMTILAWIRTSATGRQTIFSYGGIWAGTSVSLDIDQLGGTAGHLWADFYDDYVNSGVAVADGNWHQVGFTLAGGTTAITLYVDGVAHAATLPSVPDVAAGTNFQIGGFVNGCCLFNGAVDDVRVYGRVLSAAEILSLYNGGMEARWKLDEAAGATSFADATGHGHTGNCMGWPVFTCPTAGQPGAFGSAVLFDGTNHYIYGLAAGLPSGQDAVSVFAWVKTASTARQTIFFYGGASTGAAVSLDISELGGGDGHLWADFYNDCADSGVAVADGRWHHVGFTFAGGTTAITFYVDGVPYPATLPAVPNVASGTNFQIGAFAFGLSNYFDGSIDDVRVYSHALSAGEVVHYAQLAGYWKLDEGSGTSAADSSGNGGTGTLYGSPAWLTGGLPPVVFTDSAALGLDGSTAYVLGPAANLPAGQLPVSVMAWIKTASTARQTAFSYGSSETGQAVSLDVNQLAPDGHFVVDFYGDYVDSSVAVNDGNWHHVGFTLAGGTTAITIYVDGVAHAGTLGSIPTVGSGTSFQIGRWVTAGGGDTDPYYFSGAVDDVRVYSCALSAADVALLAAGRSPAAAFHTVTLGAPLGVRGSLAMRDATLDAGAGSHAVWIGGENWTLDGGSFTPRSGTVSFVRAGMQTLAGDTSFYDLTVGPNSTLKTSSNVTVGGTLSNQGWTDETKAVAGTGATAWPLAGITTGVTTQGSLTSLEVKRRDQNHPNAPASLQTGKYWNITPTGSGYSVDLTLPQNSLTDPQVCRYNSGTWDWARSGFTSTTVTRDGVTAFSDWTVGDGPPAPSPVGDGTNGTTPANFSKHAAGSSQIDVTYDAAHCPAQNAVILYGNLQPGGFSGYAGSAQCSGGNTGQATIDSSGLSNVWFDVVWQNGTTAGNPGYGFDGMTPTPRLWSAVGFCSTTVSDLSQGPCP